MGKTSVVRHLNIEGGTERLGFIYAQEPQEALDIALSHLSRDAKVAVLQRGGEILPVIK